MKKMNGIVLAGEPMALLMAKLEGPLDTVTEYSVGVAGAEFNVAVGMVRLKHKVAYATKLGNDPFGKFIVNEMNKNGISTELTTFSEQRSTGMMLKGLTSVGDPQIAYFRKGSAASTLSPEDIDRLNFDGFDVLHMTGITAALSDSAREATRCLIKRGREHGMLISFRESEKADRWRNFQMPPRKKSAHSTEDSAANLLSPRMAARGPFSTVSRNAAVCLAFGLTTLSIPWAQEMASPPAC